VEQSSDRKIDEGRESGKRFRFGSFEADLGTGVLRRNGRRVPLQEQPFQILAALLERPGEVISREELRHRLWPRQSFGDFDQGLNTAINKLRDALDDSAANARFIETLPRRGYRFVFPLEPEGAKLVMLDPPPETETPRAPGIGNWVGRYILYSLQHPDTKGDIWSLERQPEGWTARPFLQTPANESMAKLSPDGRYVAYVSDESGRPELYVQSFPSAAGKRAISSGGASQPRWRNNGRELFYVEGNVLISVAMRTQPDLSIGRATRLFAHSAFAVSRDANYDVSPDGQRFLVPERVGAQGNERMIRVVQNWFAEFRNPQRPQ